MPQPQFAATPEERGLHALSVYRRKKTYQRTADELGISKKRAHELVKRGLRVELDRAKSNDEGDTDA